MTTAASYADEGVLFASHSVGLARSTAERVYSLQKPEHHAVLSRFEQTPNYAEFLGELSFSAFREMGHDWVLLVEGTTDVKTIQQFLRAVGKDHTIVVVPLGGDALIKAGVQHELGELRRISSNIAVLIDSERKSKRADIPQSRQRFLRECEQLGFHIHATERRAIENYLTDSAIKKAKGEKYHALKPYQLLNDVNPCWAKHENWRIAREMSQDELVGTDIGQFLRSLT